MSAVQKTSPDSVHAGLKLRLNRSDLLKSLGYTQSVVERRGTIPILSNLRLDASNDMLTITATDMDISIEDAFSANIEEAGSTTVPAHTLFDIIRKLPDNKEILFEKSANDATLNISCGSSRFKLSTLPSEDFPVMEESDLTHHFALAAAELRHLFEKTRFAVSTEETRYYLNGVYLHAHQSDAGVMLRAVATDGHRLAQLEMTAPEGASEIPGVIVPRKTIAEVKKLTEQTDGEVSISLSETKIRFRCGNTVLLSKLIDGTFPDYGRVIPANNTKMLEASCKEMASVVDRVSVIATEKTRGIKLNLSPGNLLFSASSSEQGSASESLEVTYTADELEIGFNSRYLLDVLSQIEGDTAQFMLEETSSPALIRDPGDIAALYVIMPMRV